MATIRSSYLLIAIVGAASVLNTCKTSHAELYINELYTDPGGAGVDNRDEYIELRGTPNMSLANTYLIFLESEDNIAHTGFAGAVDNIFILGDDPNTPAVETPYTIGSNGFLTMRQKGSLYPAPPAGTTDIINTGSGVGWGSGPTSSIRASDDLGDGVIENGGFTALLIRNNGDPLLNQPFIGQDLDVDNDGLDSIDTAIGGWRANWTIIDSIGLHTEEGEAQFGRVYGQINFGAGSSTNIEPGAVYSEVPYEIEYVSRWGNSTGQTPDDWLITNLTDKTQAGSAGVFAVGGPDLRQSGDPHPNSDGNPNTPPPQPPTIETNKGVPYGTQLMRDIGKPNFILGDYNKDGYVDAADYTVWRDTSGQTGTDSLQRAADGDHDYLVGTSDYNVWKNHFGQPNNGSGGLGAGAISSAAPEPATLLLLAFSCVGVSLSRPKWPRHS